MKDELPRVICEGVAYVPAWEIGIAVGIALVIVVVMIWVAGWILLREPEHGRPAPTPRAQEANITPNRRPVSRR